MKRFLAGLFAILAAAGFLAVGAPAARAERPSPQCVAFIPCDDNPIERITRICQYAYCQFP